MLPSSAGDRPLDDPAFAFLFAVIEEMQLFAFMHPTGSYLSAGLHDFTLPIVVGWPTETSDAVARLIFSGTLPSSPIKTRIGARWRDIALPVRQA
jgi:aminocarboxymuconate-semialdehyde decarboxylase